MTLASAMGCISMSANWYPSRLASSSRCPQTYFFKGGRVFSYDPYLDHTCFDAGAVNTLLNFFFEDGKPFNRARGIVTCEIGGKKRWPVLAIMLSPDVARVWLSVSVSFAQD